MSLGLKFTLGPWARRLEEKENTRWIDPFSDESAVELRRRDKRKKKYLIRDPLNRDANRL